MTRYFLRPLAAVFLAIICMTTALLRATADNIPSLEGTWRWEGDNRNDDRRMVLTQNGTTVKGKINYRDGKSRTVEGTIAGDGSIELAEFIPASAATDVGMPASVWNEVVKRRGDPQHPGHARGKIKLQYSAERNELTGERTTFNVHWKTLSGFQDLKDEQDPIKFVRVLGTCGPDVTQNTLIVLKQIAQDYLQSKKSVQEARCKELVSVTVTLDKNYLPQVNATAANVAWDIVTLFDEAGDYPSSKLKEGSASRWETITGQKCCTPRWPCVKSVEFFGSCQDPQVVNYTMWGMTKVLCSDQFGINTQQKIGATIRNWESPDKADQQMMAKLGEKYGEIVVKFLKDLRRYRDLARQYQAAVRGSTADLQRFYQQLPEDLRKSPEELELTKKIISGIGGLPKDNDVANPIFFPELRQIVATHEESSKRVTRLCDAVCTQKLTEDELRQINSLKFTYRWFPR